MKARLASAIFAFAVAATCLFGAPPRSDQWKKVDEAIEQGLPKTAIEHLEQIAAAAAAEKAYAEFTRALAQKIALQGAIEGNKAEEKIIRLQAEIPNLPTEAQGVMEAVLAHWYWQYFQQNRWRFMRRTQTAEAPGPDIQTWDLARILAEIDKHFAAALANEALLKATPVTAFESLMGQSTVPDGYRPTLYDFLAHEALGFYQAGEQGTFVSEDEFIVDASSPIFDSVTEFIRWTPASADSSSPKIKAIKLYQSLLRFHQENTNRSAFIDLDLGRIAYGNNIAVGEKKAERYKAALQQLIETTAEHEVSARATAALAAQIRTEGDLVRARTLAQAGFSAFPSTAGGTMCYNLIQEIEAKELQLNTEFVWNGESAAVDVTYRNLTKIHFRAVRLDFFSQLAKSQWRFDDITTEQIDRIAAAAPDAEWSCDLPPTSDFKQRSEQVPAPKGLKPGFYCILASHDARFSPALGRPNAATVWVSDLALITQVQGTNNTYGGFVLHATTGEPLQGAAVQLWQSNRNGRFEQSAETSTDENGRFEFPLDEGTAILVASHGDQRVSTHDASRQYAPQPADRSGIQVVLFTDRALYRPGQTIYYKGIAVKHHHGIREYVTVTDRNFTTVFKDANGQEIAKTEHTPNDYGSFSGTFTAPRDRLLGSMSIEVPDIHLVRFNVEEYKRPKFQVDLPAPTEAPRLNEPVRLTGKATAYTGAAIGGAKVKWRVERGVQLPSWCWWWQPPATTAIAHGTAVTEADGTFKIEFTATPDRSIPAKNEPVFRFQIHADVTDTTGETRSDDSTVRAGYTALQITVNAGEWQTTDEPVAFAISATTLDGKAQASEGTLRIHALRQPDQVARAPLQKRRFWWSRAGEPKADPTNPDSWELGAVVAERSFTTDQQGQSSLSVPLRAGIYRASLETKDRFGKPVTARKTVQVVDRTAKRYSGKLPNLVIARAWFAQPGDNFTALWGTGYDSGRAFVELECDGKSLKRYWTPADRTQTSVDLKVTEKMRGGVTFRLTYVRDNRAYLTERTIGVPWSDKELSIRWESFRSKLTPGQKETWTAVITGADAKRATAEMVATLYDASLDQFRRHHWPAEFGAFRSEQSLTRTEFQNAPRHFRYSERFGVNESPVEWRYRSFSAQWISTFRYGSDRRFKSVVAADSFGSLDEGETVVLGQFMVQSAGRPAMQARGLDRRQLAYEAPSLALMAPEGVSDSSSLPPPTPADSVDLSKITARKNLNETAFFFPHLTADKEGVVRLEFTMPEALTEWKFMGFAHDEELRAGLLTGSAVTSKDLMVEPNPPRFVREGDAVEFTVKVSNQTDQPQSGKVRLTFSDAPSLESVDAAIGNVTPEQAFTIPAKQSRSYSWRISIPDGLGFLTYKAVAATGHTGDGEEGYLPVLSRRILVTESLPLPIRGKTTKELAFTKLLQSGQSNSLRHQSLTVQMTSQPAWYAVMALPYLMEFPHECSEQLFNRYYANSLARHIAGSDPRIRRIFEQWKNTPALDSPLEKNEDLKSVMIEETPWVRQAKSESVSRRNVALLFDQNRLDDEASRALHKLSERQLSDGLWSWFPGGRPSEYISLYIMTGFGRLRNLGTKVDVAPAVKSLAALDTAMHEGVQNILKGTSPEKYVPDGHDALYLYGRSFFLKDRALSSAHQKSVDFLLQQTRKHWLKISSRQSQAHLALALNRFGDSQQAQAIMRSIKERSVSSEEMGMYWRDLELSWWWYHAPIETQALMIEAFAEVMNDTQAVEDCKVWLLKQKQTQDWKTTKATADAVYGLLLRGSPSAGSGATNLLASDALVEVSLGGKPIKPEKVEAGTGFYEKRFSGPEITTSMGAVSLKKADEGVSWGSVHWQYLEDMTKVTPHEATPLKLKKALYIKETTSKGPVLKPVSGSVSVGDELVVRIELRTDRDMEFVHLKDQRGSGTEPVNVLSRYRYRDGLGYYESTRDTASHFFIDYLPKGVYVFEYSVRVQLKGSYQSGIAEIQCMYAPEFNSHSESITIDCR